MWGGSGSGSLVFFLRGVVYAGVATTIEFLRSTDPLAPGNLWSECIY